MSKFSQAELAVRLGVDRSYVSGLEKGVRNPTVVTLWHLSEALDVDMRELLRPLGEDDGKTVGLKS